MKYDSHIEFIGGEFEVIPTEPIGSIPRPSSLLEAIAESGCDGPTIEPLCEKDPVHALKITRRYMKPEQRVFVGVVSPIDPHVDTPEQVRDRILQAAEYIPIDQLGTTNDCGFSPFCDDISTSRETAFAKIRARVQGTALASQQLGVE